MFYLSSFNSFLTESFSLEDGDKVIRCNCNFYVHSFPPCVGSFNSIKCFHLFFGTGIWLEVITQRNLEAEDLRFACSISQAY